MKLTKFEREYIQKYGDIPRGTMNQMAYLLKSIKLNKRFKEGIFDAIRRSMSVEWRNIAFTIYLLPKSTPRPKYVTKLNFAYVKGAKDNKTLFRRFIKDLNFEPIRTSTIFHCTTYFPIPSSMNNIESVVAELGLIRNLSRPDWDNLGKTYSDMIQMENDVSKEIKSGLLMDDSLIADSIVRKRYSIKPRIEVRLQYATSYDSNYNEKKFINK